MLTALSMTACGIPNDDEPRALSPQDVPFASPGTSAVADPDGEGRVALYFVRDDRVVLTTRRVERSMPTHELVELLFAGPAREERASGLISVIPSTLSVDDVAIDDGTAVITLTGPDSEIRRLQPLAYAQIVATLTPNRVTGVRFRRGGAFLQVPRADGSLTDAPLTRGSYAQLLAPPAERAPGPAA